MTQTVDTIYAVARAWSTRVWVPGSERDERAEEAPDPALKSAGGPNGGLLHTPYIETPEADVICAREGCGHAARVHTGVGRGSCRRGSVAGVRRCPCPRFVDPREAT